MTVTMPYIPPNVYMLADNLDAALAAGEDLMKAELVWATGTGRDGADIARTRAAQRTVLQQVRSLEHMIVARILKSRERSEEIAKRDPRFATVARLYNSGTAILIEAVSDFGDPAAVDFENGGDAVAFLRAHGLLSDESPGPSEGQTFTFRDDFLIAGRIRLGTLLDLVAMYLDTLETQFDLFGYVEPETDLMPGEIDPDALEASPREATLTLSTPAVAPELQDDQDKNDSEDVDALHQALLEVRNAVALDQR